MAQNEHEPTWFDGLTWVDVSPDVSLIIPHNPNENSGTSNCILGSLSGDIKSITDKAVDLGDELKLGLLMVFPTDVIYDILCRLPIEDLIQYQLVCKSWYRMTKDPHFIDLQVSKAICRPPSYLLKPIPFNPGDNLLLVDIGETDKCTSKEIPLKSFENGKQAHIMESCNGLLCLCLTGSDEPIIYNPITKEQVTLPKSDFVLTLYEFVRRKVFHATTMGFGFGFDSTTKKYKVVRVYNTYHDLDARKFHTKGEIITVGESSWRPLDFPYKVSHTDAIGSVFLNGAFHWGIHRENHSSKWDHVLVLDITTENFQTIKFPPSVKLPEEELDLINFGETLAFVNNSTFNKDALQVWQIVGNKANGGRLCHYRFDISVIDEQFNRGMALLGNLSNGDFLYSVLQTGEVDHLFNGFRNHLLGFSPPNSHGFPLEIPRIPKCFNSIRFKPSLASPGILW